MDEFGKGHNESILQIMESEKAALKRESPFACSPDEEERTEANDEDTGMSEASKAILNALE